MITAVCTGGDEPDPVSSLGWLREADRIIAVDGGLKFLRRLGIRADLWVGDGDSLSGSQRDWNSWYKQAIPLHRTKDDTDTEAAVQIACEANPNEVWMIGGGGQRMDHWWANVRLFAKEAKLKRWLTAHEHVESRVAGESMVLAPGIVSIFPLGEGPWKIQSEGLKWPVDAVDFRTWHSLSNLVEQGWGSLQVISGHFLILTPLLTAKDRYGAES